jgi:hypothetical protein
MKFEHKHQPLLPRRRFVRRMLGSAMLAGITMSSFLCLGVAGYHWLGGLQWLDALVNASMILGGMGPVDPIRDDGGKWFESFYALSSGVVFITSMGVLLAPALHRMMHWLHVDDAAAPSPPRTRR